MRLRGAAARVRDGRVGGWVNFGYVDQRTSDISRGISVERPALVLRRRVPLDRAGPPRRVACFRSCRRQGHPIRPRYRYADWAVARRVRRRASSPGRLRDIIFAMRGIAIPRVRHRPDQTERALQGVLLTPVLLAGGCGLFTGPAKSVGGDWSAPGPGTQPSTYAMSLI
jgi:hypothetical protein